MGLPAVEMTRRTRSSRPRLRLVPPAKKRPINTRARKEASRDGFALCCVLFAGIALFGLGRVMLATQATEASMRSSELRKDIKAERLIGDLLEVDRSALTVPSRIESIACATMQMGDADCIEYMALPASVQAEPIEMDSIAAGPAVEASEPPASEGISGVLASVMEMAAGEAQVLLVGDVGIASPK